jgi:hypothetical protein
MKNFLKKKPYNLTFYNDTIKALFKRFDIGIRPLTVLVCCYLL